MNNPGFSGFTPSFLAPLSFNTNLIPQNNIVSIATAGANASAVPEPSAWTMLLGFAGLGYAGWRPRNAGAPLTPLRIRAHIIVFCLSRIGRCTRAVAASGQLSAPDQAHPERPQLVRPTKTAFSRLSPVHRADL
jgi:hypothetical protein